MGVRGLLSYVKKRVPLIHPFEVEPCKIGVDIHGLLYTWQDKVELFQAFVNDFTRYGHQLILVFDGEASEKKKELLEKRHQKRLQAEHHIRALQTFLNSKEGHQLDTRSRAHLEKEIQYLKVESWRITKEHKQQIIEYLKEKSIPYILPQGEADEELVRLERNKEIDVIMSSDMDFVRFGVNRIWIPSFFETQFKCYDLDIPIFCNDEDILIEGLKDVAELCGSEFENTNIAPKEAFGMIRYYGSLENIRRIRPSLLKTAMI